MTAAGGGPGQEAQLDGYELVIARARASLGEVTTENLVRIRELLERALEGDRPDPEVLSELAQALSGDA